MKAYEEMIAANFHQTLAWYVVPATTSGTRGCSGAAIVNTLKDLGVAYRMVAPAKLSN